MATMTIDERATATPQTGSALQDRRRLLWLGVAILLSFMATGTRWDIALAAWAAPVFLLRFVRTSNAFVGILAAWLISVATALLCWTLLGAQLDLMTVLFAIGLGTAFTPPYILDRLAGPRLSATGRLLLFPAVLASCEFLIGTFSPMGASYGIRALTQTGNLPLLQLLSVTGVYGVGFLIGWFATVVNWVWENPGTWQKGRGVVGGFLVALALVFVGGAARLAFVVPEHDYVPLAGITPSKALIANVQKNMGPGYQDSKEALANASSAKLQPLYDAIIEDLLSSTVKAARAGAKIIVWSETAAPLLPTDNKSTLLAKAGQIAKQEQIYILVASGTKFARNETDLVGPGGEVLWSYQKTNPVPGAEPTPPGNTPVPVVATPWGRLASVICFDADFPALNRVKADILFVPAYDWPEAGYAHTMKWANLRSIENGYSFFRTDFDGQSAAFDYLGHTLAAQDTTAGDKNILFAEVPKHGITTVYGVIGDLFAWLCVAGMILLLGIAVQKNRQI